MIYLTLSIDINSFLKNDFDSNYNLDELNMPSSLLKELNSWYDDYYPIILIDNNERKNIQTLIEELDKRGILLSQKLMKVNRDIKVRYYSEGLLKYCNVP